MILKIAGLCRVMSIARGCPWRRTCSLPLTRERRQEGRLFEFPKNHFCGKIQWPFSTCPKFPDKPPPFFLPCTTQAPPKAVPAQFLAALRGTPFARTSYGSHIADNGYQIRRSFRPLCCHPG